MYKCMFSATEKGAMCDHGFLFNSI